MKSVAGLVCVFAFVASYGAMAQTNPHSFHFDSKGVTIHYLVAGHGEPVMLLHGLSSSAQMNWGATAVIRELSKDYQVIALDLRGHGRSDKPKEETAYGVEMVEDVVRLMDHLKIQKARVVGYSMGGMIAMKVLALHPDRVESAILGGTGWLREGSGLQELWGRLPNRASASTPSACAHSLGALAVTEEQVRAVQVPVAMIVGDRDPGKGLYVEPLQVVRPDWPVKVVPNAGHITCILQPEFKVDIKILLDQQARRNHE
jgi:pimeloyl-ACP methyl ester carboxylesterase